MDNIDFSSLRPKRQPTRRERGLYQRWVAYLKDSRLTEDEIHSRAAAFTEQGKPVPKD
jgi:hypothetical protein